MNSRALFRLGQSASADSPFATSFSWCAHGAATVLRSRLPAGFSTRFQPSRARLSEDLTRSPAKAGSSNTRRLAARHPLKRVADGESAGSRLSIVLRHASVHRSWHGLPARELTTRM